jgi:hypothetical protein
MKKRYSLNILILMVLATMNAALTLDQPVNLQQPETGFPESLSVFDPLFNADNGIPGNILVFARNRQRDNLFFIDAGEEGKYEKGNYQLALCEQVL